MGTLTSGLRRYRSSVENFRRSCYSSSRARAGLPSNRAGRPCGPREGHDGVRGGEPPRVDINTNIRFPPSLRAAADMPYPDGKVTRYMPGLIAKIDGPDGRGYGLQRTYLTLDGEKADVDPVRKTVGSPLPPGACVRLNAPETSAARSLGIAPRGSKPPYRPVSCLTIALVA
jgi:hypothetical protein